jgi:hypothetical protein
MPGADADVGAMPASAVAAVAMATQPVAPALAQSLVYFSRRQYPRQAQQQRGGNGGGDEA